MKKLLLFTAILAGTSAVNAQTTITKDDLKWTIGNQWPSKVNIVDISTIDVTSGTGKTWDFSGYTTGGDDIVKVEASGVSDLKITSSLLGDLHYKSLTDNYGLAAISTFNALDASTGHMGLPHNSGGNWVGVSTIAPGIAITITGTVVSSGTVKIPWGTYNALLVKEAISGIMTQNTYHWETAEHGRVASFAEEKGKLMVMQSTNFTVGVEAVKASTNLSVYPNPSSSVINIEGSSAGTVTVCNTLGTVVKELTYDGSKTTVDVSGLSKGLYFVQLTSNDGVSTQSVVVE